MALPVDETALDMVDDTVAKAKVALHPYRNTLRFALGAVAAFYGRHFVFSLLYAQVIRQAWPLLRKTVGEICASWSRARMLSLGSPARILRLSCMAFVVAPVLPVKDHIYT